MKNNTEGEEEREERTNIGESPLLSNQAADDKIMEEKGAWRGAARRRSARVPWIFGVQVAFKRATFWHLFLDAS